MPQLVVDLKLDAANREVRAQVQGDAVSVMAVHRRITPHVNRQERLPDGSDLFLIPQGRLRSLLVDLVPLIRAEGGSLRRDDYVSGILTAVTSELARLREALAGNLRPIDIPDEIPGFIRTLTREQREAVAHLAALPHGANFSVPGAGKTTMLLAIHQLLKARDEVEALLVIAPRNAFRPWEEEVELCLGDAVRVRRLINGEAAIRGVLQGARDLKNTVFLVSYSQLAAALDVIERWLADHPDTHLVLDESHRIKRAAGGVWGRATRRIAPLAQRRDILTGTPLPNATLDLSGQLDWLWPFREIVPEQQLRDPGAEAFISETLKPIYRRVTKRQLGLLDPRIVPHLLVMGPLQSRIHAAITDRNRREAEGLDPRDRQVLARMARNSIRLLQVASNPALLSLGIQEYGLPPIVFSDDDPLLDLLVDYNRHEIPVKFQFVVNRIRERAERGLKTVVWSTFVRNLSMMERLLKPFGPIVVHGGIPVASGSEEDAAGTREELIDRFKTDPACSVLVANPAACGESISLHHATEHAIYVDRNFNAGQFLQSMDRIHRLGRTDQVTCEILTSIGSVDVVVGQRLQEKTVRLANILDDDGLRTLALDTDEPEPGEEFDEQDAEAVMQFLLNQPGE
jgi:SNF2 family DNA or RNA helicase